MVKITLITHLTGEQDLILEFLFWGQSICSSKASIEFIRRRERDGNPRDR
jgi:hypothetical protein